MREDDKNQNHNKSDNMELLITLTLSDRLFALLEHKLPDLGKRFERALTKEIGSQMRKEANLTIAAREASQETLQATQTDDAAQPSGEGTATRQEAPREAVAVSSQPQAAAPTLEDVRAAMHRTRQRIEGPDYKDNAEAPEVKKYHRPLNAEFMRIAALLGADKPSLLPEDKRAGFIRACDELTLTATGQIKATAPF